MTTPYRESDFVGSLCMALLHRWEPERLFMILTAYFDESGTHGGSPVTVMGGLMGNALQWRRFEVDIAKIRRKHKFRIFHTKDIRKRVGDFEGWTDEQCAALIRDFAALTGRGLMEGATFPLDNERYEKDYLGGERPKRLRLDSKYGLCFRMCLIHFCKEAIRRFDPGKPPSLHCVLESGHKNAGDAERIFAEMKCDLEKRGVDLLRTITFATKADAPPLWVADSMAYVTYAREANSRAGHPKPQMVSTKGKTAVTHLEFPPDGIAGLKERLIAEHERRVNFGRRSSSGKRLS